MSVHVNVRSFTDETVKPCPRAAAGRPRARAARPGAEELRPGRAGALAAAEGAGPGSPPGSRDGGGLGRPESSFLRISVIDGRRRDRIGRRRSTTPFESRSTPSRPTRPLSRGSGVTRGEAEGGTVAPGRKRKGQRAQSSLTERYSFHGRLYGGCFVTRSRYIACGRLLLCRLSTSRGSLA